MKLTSEQLACIDSDDRTLIIEACPGSGKTTTLLAKVEADIQAGRATPESTVVLTYTRNAGAALRSRLQTPVSFCGTVHAWAWHHHRRVKPEAMLLGNDEAMERWLAKALQARVKWSQPQAERLKRNPSTPEAKDVAAAYARDLLAENAICLDSLLWAYGHPPIPRNLYVDEAQDSAPPEQMIYDAVIVGQVCRRIYVGDPMQAIYGWRGARAEWLAAKKGRRLALTTNWRSAEEIIALANRVQGGMKGRGKPGSVEIKEFENSALEIAYLAEQVSRSGHDDMAILCRYNRTADALREALGAKPAPRPSLRRTMLLAALIADPNSAAARKRWLRHANPKNAEGIIAEADAQRRPIPLGFVLPNKFTARTLPQLAMSAGLSKEETLALMAASEDYAAHEIMLALADAPEPQTRPWIGTAHAAKGLEFRRVIIAGADYFPDRRADPQEERNLLYVAITRAIEHLTITSSEIRGDLNRPRCPYL